MRARLDRVLSENTTFSRKELRTKILKGEACVSGQPVLRPETMVDPQSQPITLCGQEVACGPVYIMLHKPAGVICATQDARHQTVIDLLDPQLRRKNLFPAGRLDRDTEGFVLLTNDGGFAHRILSPKRHVSKTYLCHISGALSEDAPERFAQGIALADGTACRPACLRILESGEPIRARVVLYEGMYHQIKRMIAACGGEVCYLRREKIGGLALDPTLLPGQARLLSDVELQEILAPENDEL